MKLKKNTVILLIAAILLAGSIYLYESFGKPRQEQIRAEQKKLFSLTEAEITGLIIETQEHTLEFKRSEDDNNWLMAKPQAVNANNASVSFLLNLLESSQSDRLLNVEKTELSEYGLETPIARIKIELKDQKEHQLLLGDPNFENTYIYAQIDPKNEQEQVEIILIPREFEYAVARDLSEWKQEEIPEAEATETTPADKIE